MAKHSSESTKSTHQGLTPERAFGQVLRELRLSRGFTQADLEATSQIDRAYLSQLENAKRQVCLKYLIQLSHGLNVDIGDLLKAVINRIDSAVLEKMLHG